MPVPTLFTTLTDYIDQVIEPSLGDEFTYFDVRAIANAMLTYNAERDGFVVRDDVDFWSVVAANEIDA